MDLFFIAGSVGIFALLAFGIYRFCQRKKTSRRPRPEFQTQPPVVYHLNSSIHPLDDGTAQLQTYQQQHQPMAFASVEKVEELRVPNSRRSLSVEENDLVEQEVSKIIRKGTEEQPESNEKNIEQHLNKEADSSEGKAQSLEEEKLDNESALRNSGLI